ncbi:MAG: FGGY-family carbohydrate kinase [Lachnospiraceae bacterium]|jgi:sugar (pentulose or hexulose) kinase|nr:FGGY-family carbohydrate kinase [Lachnospiraceae bacterium]
MQSKDRLISLIKSGDTALGIEFGSTRIKAVLVGGDKCEPLASGSHEWENRFEAGVWTYTLADVWEGLAAGYASLLDDIEEKYAVKLETVGAIGVSAMMHGYMPFDSEGNLLTPFRTWRNTSTGAAAAELTALFNYNVPQRFSIAHLYQAILDKKEHLGNISYVTTLAGYVHWQLTGERVTGVGDASGIFPIAPDTKMYHPQMADKFADLIKEENYPWQLADILPKPLFAGEAAGRLTAAGAKLIDPSGNLTAGIPLCPPEGDAGTGMVATNSVRVRTGNVSAGTSVFAMVVLEKELERVHPEIDLVTTPDGFPVAMAHANNCTSDINEWVALFAEFAKAIGSDVPRSQIFDILYMKALEADIDLGGLLAYNYLSGEHITGLSEGRPLFVRMGDSNFTLANFMRTHLFTSLAALKVGLDILLDDEGVKVERIYGHGGLFKTEGVGQGFLAAAVNVPVYLMESAGEGGAWGIAILASFMRSKAEDEALADYLEQKIFVGEAGKKMLPDPEHVRSFALFSERYKKGLPIEEAAVKWLQK